MYGILTYHSGSTDNLDNTSTTFGNIVYHSELPGSSDKSCVNSMLS
jgi:hypothetical protein